MSLTDLKLRSAKLKEKPYKLFDSRGLFLLVNPSGSKLWRYRYTLAGLEKQISFGPYPEVFLADARDQRDEARKHLRQGINPSDLRKAKKAEQQRDENTFELVAREWFAKFSPTWATSHSSKVIRRLEKDVFPWLGERPISKIMANDLLKILRKIEARGAIETAHRTKQTCGQILRYAIATGRADRDYTADLKGVLPSPKRSHHASIKDRRGVGELLRSLDGYRGQPLTQLALRLAPLVFVRPGELRGAEWSEMSLDNAEWRIDASRMKMRVEHIVPLSDQAMEILRELEQFTGGQQYVFPGIRSSKRCMSDNTLNAALRRLGYTHDEMTAHGFRSMASTLLNELGYNRDAIERQLAHAERNTMRAAYNYAEYLPQRKKMMQEWSDFLDDLKGSAQVVPIFGTEKHG